MSILFVFSVEGVLWVSSDLGPRDLSYDNILN